MKKIFLLFGTIMMITSSIQAQEETGVAPKGKYAIDVTFDPAAFFDAGAGPMFEMPLIKARYFMSSDLAIRLGLGLGIGSTKDYLDANGDNYTKDSYSLIAIAPGIEKHFGAGRFTPYVGAEVSFTNYSDKTITQIGDTKTEDLNENGYLGFGFNGVFGADLYILPGFYVGAEFTPGLTFRKDKDETLDGTVVTSGGNSISFNLASSSGIKIGFRF
jgi:hypothetical protein